MGAATFKNYGTGRTAKEAFAALVERSRHEDGHSYSGCVGMKTSFLLVRCPEGVDPSALAEGLYDDPRFEDKHGPAGCVPAGEGRWLFFGWAAD